jgi:hypothetical protein
MFGCIGRLVVLGVVLIVAAAGYVTRDRWAPAVMTRITGRNPSTVARWEPVTPAGAARARAALDSLKRPAGAAFVNVQAGDIVALAVEPLLKRLAPASKEVPGPEARAETGLLRVRGSVKTSDLGGAAALGPLAGVLEGTQTIEVRGGIEVPAPGRAAFIVTRISVGDLVLPSAAIGRVIQQLAPRREKTQSETAVMLTLPATVADVRLRPGRVTLYKAAP